MRFSYSSSQLSWLTGRLVPLILLLAGAVSARGACNITSGNATGYVGIPFVYQIGVNGRALSYNANGLPPGLTVDTTTGIISGIPSVSGTYSSVILSVTCNSGSDIKTVTFTITLPPIPASAFVGFRLPDFLTPPGVPPTYTPRLMLQMGAADLIGPHPFNATLEVDASDNHDWSNPVPYNRFVGLNDPVSWITNAPLPVRDALTVAGLPRDFSTAQLTQTPPGVYMKADPRATRFGIFQMDDVLTTTKSRIMLPLWPSGYSTVQNGFGGTVSTNWPGPVEHAPNRFAGSAYYPGTFCINGPVDARDTATTTYADNDNVTRPADAIYPGAATTTGSSTPYYDTGSAPSRVYHPIMLNRPFRSVAELGYAFRDLPWKTLDFFTDKSADAGLLDIFTINDGAQLFAGTTDIVGMTMPTVVAGQVNSNAQQSVSLQPIFAGAILNELDPSNAVSNTGNGATSAPVLASNVVNATSTTPMQNKAELITRAGLPTAILPTASNDNQAVKTRREVVSRTLSSVSQTRVWNLLIDVVTQTGRFKPNAANLQNDFVVEGEQHYWVHVAIDRFTGQVIDKQIEVVNE
jgi:Putative Ig domain